MAFITVLETAQCIMTAVCNLYPLEKIGQRWEKGGQSRIDQGATEGLIDPAGDVLWLLGLMRVAGPLEDL